MDRRRFLYRTAFSVLGLTVAAQPGCRGTQTAQVMKPGQADMVGSHAAGAETWKPLVETAVGNLLTRHYPQLPPGAPPGAQPPAGARICFIAVENKSQEELGDFKEQLYQQIDTRIVKSQVFQPIDRRVVIAGLQQTRLRPDELYLPENRRQFAATLEQMNQPFDYLLYATITSGTTRSNKDYQRDYVLTLEMVNIQSGQYDKESAEISKGYNASLAAKLRHLGPF